MTRVAYFWRTLPSEDYTLSLELCIYSHFVTSSINKCFILQYLTWPTSSTSSQHHNTAVSPWVSEWADCILVLVIGAFSQLPNTHFQVIPRLCYGAYDVDTGRYTLNSGGGSGPNAVWSEPVFPVWRGETLLHGLPYGCQLTEARRKGK